MHDASNVEIVYEVVYLGEKPLSRRSRDRKLDKVKSKYRKILRSLAKNRDPSKLTGDNRRVYDVITSYSIHYTKLYEPARRGQGGF